jgi:transcriptional regulator with XRE-family HTH domain
VGAASSARVDGQEERRMDPDERELRRVLAVNVVLYRNTLKLTVEQAAEHADLDRRHWQKVEAGEVNVTLRTLTRLSRALRVAVPLLFVER